MAGLQSIPQELIESASLDGANKWQLFKQITLPFRAPGSDRGGGSHV